MDFTGTPITIADVILEVVPFSASLVQWCHATPGVKSALKFANADSFLPIGAVLTSYPKVYTEDQVIGFLVYDAHNQIFKQDYIINKNDESKDFVLYTKVPGGRDTTHVKHIKQFLAKYDIDGSYARSHHLTIEQLDEMAITTGKPDIARMAHSMVERSKTGWRNVHSQDELINVLKLIRIEKSRQGLADSKSGVVA